MLFFRAIYLVPGLETVKQVIQAVRAGMPVFTFPKD
jgi:hypothetical protein